MMIALCTAFIVVSVTSFISYVKSKIKRILRNSEGRDKNERCTCGR